MTFNYEQSIWGKGTASLRWGDPTAFRLKMALGAFDFAQASAPTPPTPSQAEGDMSGHSLRVLELGCGAGQFIRAVKKYRPNAECYGSDISQEALTLARTANDGVSYVVSEENRLPFENNFFDAVLIFDVLEHVQNPTAILTEVQRVLKPGGVFYAFVPCEGDWTSFWHCLDMFGLKRDLTKKYAGHINYFSRAELRTLFRTHNFGVLRTRYSEHLLGQLLGIVAFHLMDRAAKRAGTVQINNETYFEKQSGGVVRLIKKSVNVLVYLESTVLQWIPSPNVHIILKKQSITEQQ